MASASCLPYFLLGHPLESRLYPSGMSGSDATNVLPFVGSPQAAMSAGAARDA